MQVRVYVFRKGAWEPISSYFLVPGDLISVSRNKYDPEQTVPADVLLLSGKVVVSEAILTGEATPQEKLSIANRDAGEALSLKRSDDTGDRQHVVFGGTKVLQVVQDQEPPVKGGVPRPPGGGCLAVVLRNGFNTEQGRLVRTIMFSSETTTAASREAGIFVVCLLCFALAASGYVLSVAWNDPKRNKGKLLLNCATIIASVVPPELPMNLSLAVNSSLQSLIQLGVFCTEPFRIPFAGKVGVCCFDKTGTLTSEDLVLEGVAGAGNAGGKNAGGEASASGGGAASCAAQGPGKQEVWALAKPRELGDEAVLVLVGCHGLVLMDDGVIGETMERVAQEALGWSLARGDAVVENGGGRRRRITVINRYSFASSLARMATIVEVAEGGKGTSKILVLAKGAPETMASRFASLPPMYERSYLSYTRQGARVLALGYKELAPEAISKLKSKKREDVESDLVFAGLVVYHCPNKFETKTSIQALKQSGHRLVMITGDQTLTACHVARELGMCRKDAETLILSPCVRDCADPKLEDGAGGGGGGRGWSGGPLMIVSRCALMGRRIGSRWQRNTTCACRGRHGAFCRKGSSSPCSSTCACLRASRPAKRKRCS